MSAEHVPAFAAAPERSRATIMDLKEFLFPRRAAILQKWFDRIVAVYPRESQNFLKARTDPFANPIGGTIREGIGRMYDEIFPGGNLANVGPILEQIVKIHVIQDFSPGEALAFLPIFRKVLESEIEGERRSGLAEELRGVDARIDLLTGCGLQMYDECRKKISSIKAAEQDRSRSVMERMTAFYEKRGETAPAHKRQAAQSSGESK